MPKTTTFYSKKTFTPEQSMAVYDTVGAITAYEAGELDWEGTVELFQTLIDTGMVWRLQGSYGRTAVDLIKAGECTTPAQAA